MNANTLKVGDTVTVLVSPYNARLASYEQRQTIKRITPTGRLRLCGGRLFRDENGQWVSWHKGVMGLDLADRIVA